MPTAWRAGQRAQNGPQGPALAGRRATLLAFRLSAWLGRNGQTLCIDAILDLVLPHVEEDMPVILVFMFGVEPKCPVIANPW